MLNVQNLTNTLSRMPLPQLQQYAALHKDDPYVVSLALSIANQKKQMMAGQAGQAGMQPQPKVVDQAIAEMAPVVGALPEDVGIGALPAQNMQRMAGGGIVAFEGGGEVPGYAEGIFTKVKKKYKELKGYEFEGGPEMFDKALDAEGIKDPRQRAFLKSIHAQESDQALRAPTRDKSGAAGPMQVTSGAWKDVANKGEKLNSIDDPYENMRAGIRYASTGWKKSNGNPVLAGAYYYGGPGGLAKAAKGESVASAEDKGQTTLDYGKKVANRLPSFLPAPTAQAQAPSDIGSDASFSSAIMGAANDQTKPSASDSSKAGVISSGLAALGNALPAVYEAFTPSFKPSTTPAQALTRTATTAGPLAAVGLTGGTLSAGAANALSNATPEELDQLSTDIGSDTGLAAAIMNAPNRPPEKPPMPYGEQMLNVAKTIVGHPDIKAPPPPPDAENLVANKYPPGVMGGAVQPSAEEGIVAALKEKTEEKSTQVAAAPEEKKEGMDWNDFMIKMGLNLMAGDSPNALTNIGKAGLGTLAMQQAEAKALADLEARKSESEYRKAMGIEAGAKAKQAEAMTAAIERGAKEKNLQLEAEKLIAQEISKDKFLNMPGQEAARAAREAQMRATIYRQLGIEPTMASGAPAGQRLTYNPETGKIG
jgi:hypothetical protein